MANFFIKRSLFKNARLRVLKIIWDKESHFFFYFIKKVDYISFRLATTYQISFCRIWSLFANNVFIPKVTVHHFSHKLSKVRTILYIIFKKKNWKICFITYWRKNSVDNIMALILLKCSRVYLRLRDLKKEIPMMVVYFLFKEDILIGRKIFVSLYLSKKTRKNYNL